MNHHTTQSGWQSHVSSYFRTPWVYPQTSMCTYRCTVIAIGKAPKQIKLSCRVYSGRKRSNCERQEYKSSRHVELGFSRTTLDLLMSTVWLWPGLHVTHHRGVWLKGSECDVTHHIDFWSRFLVAWNTLFFYACGALNSMNCTRYVLTNF